MSSSLKVLTAGSFASAERGFVARTEAVLGDDLLSFSRVEEVEVGLGHVRRSAPCGHGLDDGDRRRGLDAERRIDDVELVAELVP